MITVRVSERTAKMIAECIAIKSRLLPSATTADPWSAQDVVHVAVSDLLDRLRKDVNALDGSEVTR